MLRTFLLRRLPILAPLLAALWLFQGGGSQEVALTWVLPEEPQVTEARVRVVGEDGAVASSIAWGSERHPAERHLAHRAFLAPGAYRIQAVLHRADGTTKDLERELHIDPEDDAIRVHLE